MKIIKKTCIFFGVFLLYHIIFSNFFQTDANGYLIAPDWYIFPGLALGLAAACWDKLLPLFGRRKHRRPLPIEPVMEPVIPPRPGQPEQVTQLEAPLSRSAILNTVDAMDGHAFEYWCADLLRNNGFVHVSVTKGSGDQGVDVLAEKDGVRYAIQCKCYSHDLGNTPVQEVNAGRIIYHCHIGAVMTNRYFTKGAVEAAEATGVLLWDRSWLEDHLKEPVPASRTATDPLLRDALELVRACNGATPDIICKGLGIGYARAARIVDQMEELGYVGPFRGSTPREILK